MKNNRGHSMLKASGQQLDKVEISGILFCLFFLLSRKRLKRLLKRSHGDREGRPVTSRTVNGAAKSRLGNSPPPPKKKNEELESNFMGLR